MPYVICEPCVGIKDKACVAVCPVDCIYEGAREGFPDMMYIHPDECVDCGICQPECPVDAIFLDEDVPDRWQHYTESEPPLLRASVRVASPRRRHYGAACAGSEVPDGSSQG